MNSQQPITAWVINTPLILVLVSLVSIIFGLFVFLKPELAIEIQRRFYELLNWRIEPISMPKEIRNTKIMGISLVVVAIGTIIYYCLRWG